MVENLHQLRNPALQSIRKPHQCGDRRHFRAALDVTDRGNARPTKFGEIALRQTSSETDLADAFADELSFIAAMRAHLDHVGLDKRPSRIYPF